MSETNKAEKASKRFEFAHLTRLTVNVGSRTVVLEMFGMVVARFTL